MLATRDPAPRRGTKIAFFSRGRGRGHAVPDIALLRELQNLDPAPDVTGISYGTGARTFREHGLDVVDLDLPDRNPFLETQQRVVKVLSSLAPAITIAHEEFCVPPSSTLLGIPCLFITDYFVRPVHLCMQCLKYASRVLFIDRKGLFEEPPYLQGKVHYTEPFVRPFAYARADYHRARHELGLEQNSRLILVLPGGWFTEDRAPVFDLILAAYRSLPGSGTKLVWFAGDDFETLTERANKESHNIEVRRFEPAIDRWLAAADVAITKATRKTALELEYLRVPSISLSHGLNPIDDRRVSQIETNTHLKVHGLLPDVLAMHLLNGLAQPPCLTPQCVPRPLGFQSAAFTLAGWINESCRSANPQEPAVYI